jgi:hypothetical protein
MFGIVIVVIVAVPAIGAAMSVRRGRAPLRPPVNATHDTPEPTPTPGVDLYWLPLGAGGSFVKFNGRVFETLEATIGRRRPRDLYHSALKVNTAEGSFVIEITPVPDSKGGSRGVISEGAVGSRYAAHWRVFRYELRC